jgi:autoinducer 2-degrading protein
MIVTTVTIFVKTDHIDAFIEATKENHDASVAEPGNLRFDVSRCADDPNRFLLYEAYISEEASAAHKQTDHYIKWRDSVALWMSQPRIGVKHHILFPADKNKW